MAFRKTLAQGFAKVTSSRTPALAPSQHSLLRRHLHVQRRPIFHSAAAVPVPADRFPGIPVGDQIMDRILGMTRGRIRLEGLAPPQPLVTAEEARKAVRAAQVEAARARLRGSARSCVAYPEFAAVCGEVAGGDEEEGGRLARAMDEAGAVIVLGDVVFESRFAAKQSRLMTARRFDLDRYNQLRRGDSTNHRHLIDDEDSSSPPPPPCHRRSTFIGAVH